MTKLRRAAAMIAATTVALAVAAIAIPASAATANAASGTRATTHEVAAPLSVSPRGFSSCPINPNGQQGEYICGTQTLTVSLGADALYFVIGTNWAIWETSSDGDPWRSLGGQALHTTNNGVYVWSYSPNLVIWTWGTDGQQWCDTGEPASWSGWYRCVE